MTAFLRELSQNTRRRFRLAVQFYTSARINKENDERIASERLIVQDYIEQRAVDLQSAFCTASVVNKT